MNLMLPTLPQAEPIAAGSCIGGYIIQRVIGRGGMSVVYEAEHAALGRRVALKVLRGPATGDGRLATRFLREARIVSRIRHPNVVSVFDIGAHDDVLFLAMDLLECEDMAAALA